MSLESIADRIGRAVEAGEQSGAGPDREEIARLAAEFESMLMLQMLKEMRKAGSWDDEASKDGLGAQTMLETIDLELASYLSRVQGFGLAKELFTTLGLDPQEATAAPALPAPLNVPEGSVTSAYGWRSDPFNGAARFHSGIDIRAAYGQDVPTAGAGRVLPAGTEGGYGETVVIEHAGGLRTRYAHLSAVLVDPGDRVTQGQIVGRAGASGRATGTHLHFEVLAADGTPVNPHDLARFKAQGVAADLLAGTTPGLQETRR